ncbi:MAG: hypothetical protein WAM91_13175 [Candidatus Acidiferrales bacterium]
MTLKELRYKFSSLETILIYALRATLFGGLVAAIAYWIFLDKGLYLSRIELSVWLGIIAWGGIELFLYRQAQPRKMTFTFDRQVRYWTYMLPKLSGPDPFDPKTTRICIATGWEKEQLPKPQRAYGIQIVGKVHCVVDNEFWVWQETFPWEKTEDGVLLHPNVR